MKKYPFEKQDNTNDCGASCLSMIIKYYNGFVPKEDLIDLTKTNKSGTTAYHLTKTLKELGFEAYGLNCSIENLKYENINLPCIANVIIENSYKHFIVIYKININKNYLIIADPAEKIKKITFKQFERIYQNTIIIAIPIQTIPVISVDKNKFILNNLLKHKNFFKKLIILSFLLTILSIINSFVFEYISIGINTKSCKYIILISTIFFSTSIFKNLFNFIRTKLIIKTNQKIDYDLTTNIFQKIIMLPYKYYRNRTTGDIISRINDLNLIKETITQTYISLIIDLPISLICLLLLFIINKNLFYLTLLFSTIEVFIVLIFKKTHKQNIQNIAKAKSETTSSMVESIQGFETIKGIHIEKTITNEIKKKQFKLNHNILKYQKFINYQYTITQLITELELLTIISFGSIQIIKNNFSIGKLITFYMIFNLFKDQIKNLLNLDNQILETKTSIKRINEILNKKEKEPGNITKQLSGNITFKNLTYSFNDRDIILKNINLQINEKQKIMITGKSGSGKSTLLKLLMKYYQAPTNHIFIDGLDINQLTNKTINKSIIYLNQEEILFNTSIYNNINISKKSQEEFLKVTKLCHTDEIASSNLGYNEIIEENGFNISGGEKQRIVLARTLLQPFNILIIDEGLNQLDTELERNILKNIFKEYKDKTIIVISHRLDNADLFNRTITIQNGKIICKKKG